MREGKNGQGRETKAVQAGTRKQPVAMPAQHLAKPGNEHDLQPAPRYDAPD